MRMISFPGLLAMALVAAAGPAAADNTLSCGSKLIETGMTAAEVLKHCGEPASRKVEDQAVHSGNRIVGTTQFQIWSYERSGATRVLKFDQDKLMSIE